MNAQIENMNTNITPPSPAALIGGLSDMNWLFSTHLKNFQKFKSVAKSAVIEGDETAPSKVFLFKKRMPFVTNKPLGVYVVDGDGNLEVETEAEI